MQTVGAVLDDNVGHHAIAMADLCIEDAVFNLGFLYHIGRRNKIGVAGAREAFRSGRWEFHPASAVVSGAAERRKLNCDAAVWIGVLARMAFEIAARGGIDHAGVRVAIT